MSKTTLAYLMTVFGICMILMLTLVACGGSAGNPLDDTTWKLTSLSGSDLLAGTAITIEFAADEVSGSGGCNHYGGSYQSSGNDVSISDLSWTEMGCMEPEGILEQESAYLAALGAADSYQIAGDRLEIFDEAGRQILGFGASTTVGEEPPTEAASEQPETPVTAEPAMSENPESREPDLTAQIDVPTSLDSGAVVMVGFTLTNRSSEGFYVLRWFTPLEGMAGDMFRVELDGAELEYRGKLVKRGSPLSEEYVWLEAGESVSAEIDLAEGYDFSQAGQYTIQFRSPQISQLAKTEAEQADSLEGLGMIQIPSNAVQLVVEKAIADTPVPSPVSEPPPGYKPYQDSVVGVSVYVPESWTVIEVEPGRLATLQSYPEDKYVGGEARQAGDTKCDLTIRPPDVDLEGHMQQLRSNDTITIVSEDEVILDSGRPGIRVEVESMGRSTSLITEVNARVVVLTCFGELALFDEIAFTMGATQ